MKKTIHLALCLLIALTGICSAADAAKPAAAAKKPEAKAPAKKPAPKKIDPKVAAENARYYGIPKVRREYAKALDEEYPKFMEAWIELRDTMAEGAELDLVWGTRARRDAEKRKLSLASDLRKLTYDYEKEKERTDKKLSREATKQRKEVAELKDRPRSSSEKLNAMIAEQVSKESAILANLDGMLQVMVDMQSATTASSTKKIMTRLEQVGATHGHGQGLNKDQQRQYGKIIDIVYTIKDYKADIAAFEARKAEGKDWDSRDEATLRRLQQGLEREGAKVEQYVERDRVKLKREIDDLKRDIEQLDRRLEHMSEGKSFDKYQQEKWDTEAEVIQFENTDKILVHFADWKPKPDPAEKKGAAAKKKAGH